MRKKITPGFWTIYISALRKRTRENSFVEQHTIRRWMVLYTGLKVSFLFFFLVILNPKNPKEAPKSFSFDHSYWSHTTVMSLSLLFSWISPFTFLSISYSLHDRKFFTKWTDTVWIKCLLCLIKEQLIFILNNKIYAKVSFSPFSL